MFEYKDLSLGKLDKYYTLDSGNIHVHENFIQAIDFKFKGSNTLELNHSSIYQVLSNYFMVGDSTIIKEIKRTPWLSTYEKNNFNLLEVPRHYSNIISTEIIALELFELLKEELIEAVGNFKKIGILLSGGMDSRFVAGILHYLIKNKKVNVNEVIAYTWGEEDSRDYQYAKLISEYLGWEFKSYKIDNDVLVNNIYTAAERGCEYSCLHLHAMPSIGYDSKNDQVELILAGSYGDSIGRGEYSGKHISQLKDLSINWGKYSYILNMNKSKSLNNSYLNELNLYRRRFNDREDWQIYEIEYQCHYMRRMLNPCMETISEYTPLYQMFTHPNVYGYIWSLNKAVRNDLIYSYMLHKIDKTLMEIPWARTGLPYGKSGQPDDFKKSHNRYKSILNFESLEFMESTILSSVFFDNNSSIKSLFKLIKKMPSHNIDFLERLSYLTSVAIFLNKNSDNVIFDKIENFKSDEISLFLDYIYKNTYRKIRRLI